MPKKKPTEQELKDRLWKMATEVDMMSGDNVDNHEDWKKWEADFMKTVGDKTVKVGGFEATPVDIHKILGEVEGSCLTDKCKKSLTAALKAALK